MSPPTKPISLSDIHNVYRGVEKKRETTESELSYRKTNRFSRDAGHSGVTANRPPSPGARKVR